MIPSKYIGLRIIHNVLIPINQHELKKYYLINNHLKDENDEKWVDTSLGF